MAGAPFILDASILTSRGLLATCSLTVVPQAFLQRSTRTLNANRCQQGQSADTGEVPCRGRIRFHFSFLRRRLRCEAPTQFGERAGI